MNCVIFNGLTSSVIIAAGSCVFVAFFFLFSPTVSVTEVGLTYFQQQ